MSSNRLTVLILASDPAFSREITDHWPDDAASHSNSPEFIVIDKAFSGDLKGGHYDLVIADASLAEMNTQLKNEINDHERNNERPRAQALTQRPSKNLKPLLVAAGKPAIIVHSNLSADFYSTEGAVIELCREAGLWPWIVGLVGREILRRVQAESLTREARALWATAEVEATLGRYMVEMRTNVNNALTTVLGNAELLVVEPGLPATVLAQADTIRNMALRLHEVFQRFCSLEKELIVAVRESGKKASHATAGR